MTEPAIVIHAGMPKTGSTSLQVALRLDARRLAEDHGIHVLADAAGGLAPYREGPTVAANAFPLRYHAALQRGAAADELEGIARDHGTALAELAARHGTIVISSEALSTPLVRRDDSYLRGLNTIGDSTPVRFVYYVRPQHDALESQWRQWGYKSGRAPSAWVESAANDLDYAGSLEHARQVGPAVAFEARPFRPDLLRGGDVVADFFVDVLGVPDPTTETALDENPGLSLDLVALLRDHPELYATPGVGVGGQIETALRQHQIAKLVAGWDIAASPEAVRSRLILQHFSHDRFEPANRRLIAAEGWATDHFVASSTDPGGQLGELDHLWQRPTDPTAAAYFRAALTDLIAAEESRR